MARTIRLTDGNVTVIKRRNELLIALLLLQHTGGQWWYEYPVDDRETIPDGEKRYRGRFDFADPAARVAVEVQGLMGYGGHEGAHRGIAGYLRDLKKHNLALRLGWTVVYAHPQHEDTLRVVDTVNVLLQRSRVKRE